MDPSRGASGLPGAGLDGPAAGEEETAAAVWHGMRGCWNGMRARSRHPIVGLGFVECCFLGLVKGKPKETLILGISDVYVP